jgi:PhoH-like ATPase
MRLLASTAADIVAEDYKRDTLPDSGYTGLVQVQVEREVLDSLYENKTLRVSSVSDELKDVPTNTGVIVKAGRSSAIARISSQGALEIIPQELEAFGVKGRSAEQRIALAHLLDDSIGIVSMSGSGGTGKSMLALAAGLEAVLERRTKKKIVVFRPLLAVGGQELGFLPGTEAEKMNPWAAAVFDALSAFTSKNVLEEVIDRGIIEVLPLTHIRGRTFTDTIIIVDEAQNLERNVLLTALSRTGDNSRVFISSDVAQRDNLRVGRHDGIASVVEKLKGEELFAHIKLIRSERSQVAEMVTRLLDE